MPDQVAEILVYRSRNEDPPMLWRQVPAHINELVDTRINPDNTYTYTLKNSIESRDVTSIQIHRSYLLANRIVMKKIIFLLVCITSANSMLWGQEGITLTQGNKAFYRLTVSGDRSYSDGPWFFGTTICDRGMQEIRFLDKNNGRITTVDTGGKTGRFQYDTGDHEFTKDQFPIKVHIDNKFVDRLLCKGFAIYDFPQSWYTDVFRDRGMNVIKVDYNGACYSRGYSGFWEPDDRYYGDIFYYHAAYVYMRDLEVRSDPVVEVNVPSGPFVPG